MYYKAVDPQTGAAEFVEFAVVQPMPQQIAAPVPQYATVADIEAIHEEMARIREMIPASPTRRAKGADPE